MVIERSGFLVLAGTLAAGGVGGWFARDSKAQHDHSEDLRIAAMASAAPVVTSAAAVERVPPPPPLPACDDNVGVPEDCPAVGPSDEGVCSNIAAKRCAEFKSAFKPKVAQAAVSCLRHLKGNELCDPARVNQCGHAALMAACPDPSSAPNASDGGVNALSSPVVLACDNIAKSCANQPLAPSPADCRQTLAGMTDFGRASMTECLATHCGDKGLLGCEALKKP